MIFTALISSREASKFHAAVQKAHVVPIRGADKFEQNKILKGRKRVLLGMASLKPAVRMANLAPQNTRAASDKILKRE